MLVPRENHILLMDEVLSFYKKVGNNKHEHYKANGGAANKEDFKQALYLICKHSEDVGDIIVYDKKSSGNCFIVKAHYECDLFMKDGGFVDYFNKIKRDKIAIKERDAKDDLIRDKKLWWFEYKAYISVVLMIIGALMSILVTNIFG